MERIGALCRVTFFLVWSLCATFLQKTTPITQLCIIPLDYYKRAWEPSKCIVPFSSAALGYVLLPDYNTNSKKSKTDNHVVSHCNQPHFLYMIWSLFLCYRSVQPRRQQPIDWCTECVKWLFSFYANCFKHGMHQMASHCHFLYPQAIRHRWRNCSVKLRVNCIKNKKHRSPWMQCGLYRTFYAFVLLYDVVRLTFYASLSLLTTSETWSWQCHVYCIHCNVKWYTSLYHPMPSIMIDCHICKTPYLIYWYYSLTFCAI